ncbi:MAG: hypothetical protein J7J42_01795 [Thermoplasmata archaeon]|nr:hypothetical protein [Thermoplasmata archaeon]
MSCTRCKHLWVGHYGGMFCKKRNIGMTGGLSFHSDDPDCHIGDCPLWENCPFYEPEEMA